MIVLLGFAVAAILLYELYVNEAGPNTIPGYAKAAGFSGTDLAIAVAIAYAESSGDPNAVGDNGDSIGLWQINLPNHPEYNRDSLFDSQTNANAAFDIYRAAGNSFSPWTTFKTGAYSSFLSGADSNTDTFSADNGGYNA
jgi:soluble lytic murein transglycosylase-like protein